MLILAAVCTNYGLWNTDIPLGDEAGYVGTSFGMYQNSNWSSNIYYDTYILIFKYITQDPITAHYYVRFIASLLSVVGLFLLLSTLESISLFGAFVMALLWNISILNIPLVQGGSINVFAFALALISGYLWLGKFGKSARIIALIILLAVINIRPEYSLLLFIIFVQRTMLWLQQLKNEGWVKPVKIKLFIVSGSIICIVVVLIASSNIRKNTSQLFYDMDGYLFLGLQQCYSQFVVNRDPQLHLEPMTEYDIVMNERFPHARGFIDAIRINPLEAGRYFLFNGIANLTPLAGSLLNYHSILFFRESVNASECGLRIKLIDRTKMFNFDLWIIAIFIIAGNICFLVKFIRRSDKLQYIIGDQAVYIFGLAAVAITPLLLLLSDSRYWIMVFPLFYWGPASFVSKYCAFQNKRVIVLLSIVIGIIFAKPVFANMKDNTASTDKQFVLALRNKMAVLTNYPVTVLGVFPSPLLDFTIIGKFTATDYMVIRQGNSYENIVEAREPDLFIIDDWIKSTYQYQKELNFFNDYYANPEKYGYELFFSGKMSDGEMSYIFSKKLKGKSEKLKGKS